MEHVASDLLVADAETGEQLALTALSLARRFHGGATLWCIAPSAPEHARHVAVEFVHPVLVGKRALPAVSVGGHDPAAALRALARSGDVILVMSSADDDAAGDVLRRAVAWGALTVWMGWGPRPSLPSADHVIWAASASTDEHADAQHDGSFVLLYHVLWELTHVCFEHPGLLTAAPDCTDEICITCSDEGRVGEVIGAADTGLATVRTARGIEHVDTTLIAEVAPGDLLLIHAGTAIAEVP